MEEARVVTPQIRRLGEMVEILYDRNFAVSANPSQPIYYVYRDLPFSRPIIAQSLRGLRYDVTVIPPFMLGEECAKTYGHYHSIALGSVTYAEIYEVLQGTLHALLQKNEQDRVGDVCLIEGHPGEKIVIPPNYGHVLINPGEETLATGNLISKKCTAEYESWRVKRGAAYYELKGSRLLKNPSYGETPEVRRKAPQSQFPAGLRLTDLLQKTPSDFDFLTDPLSYSEKP